MGERGGVIVKLISGNPMIIYCKMGKRGAIQVFLSNKHFAQKNDD